MGSFFYGSGIWNRHLTAVISPAKELYTICGVDDNQNQEHESNLSVYAADAGMGIGENPMDCRRNGTYQRKQSEYRHPFSQTPRPSEQSGFPVSPFEMEIDMPDYQCHKQRTYDHVNPHPRQSATASNFELYARNQYGNHHREQRPVAHAQFGFLIHTHHFLRVNICSGHADTHLPQPMQFSGAVILACRCQSTSTFPNTLRGHAPTHFQHAIHP